MFKDFKYVKCLKAPKEAFRRSKKKQITEKMLVNRKSARGN